MSVLNRPQPPTSWYDQLRLDVSAARTAGTKAAAEVADGGSCNLDFVVLQLDTLPGPKVRSAIGVQREKHGWYGWGYALSLSVGQADKNYAGCKAIVDYLTSKGYTAYHYYLTD